MSAANHAWVDESMRTEQGSYIMAAVLAPPEECDPIRETFRRLRVRKEHKTHWRSESERVRERICQAVVSCQVQGIVVVGLPLLPTQQERARTKVLEHLLFHLDQTGVERVMLEQRTESLNRRDMKTVDRLRGRQVLAWSTRVEWGQPSTEPMLWVADAVAGAVGDAIAGKPRWLDIIQDRVTRLEVSVR